MSSEEKQPTQTITVDEKAYPVHLLPKDVQDLIAYYSRWEAEYKEAMSEARKCELACGALSEEITARIRDLEKQLKSMAELSKTVEPPKQVGPNTPGYAGDPA